MTPQETVERALALSTADGCVVVADEHSHADLRWAENSLTTNGVSRSRTLTVIATVGGERGTAVGTIARGGATADQVEAVVREAEHAARTGTAADDAQPLARPEDTAPAAPWDDPPAETSARVFASLAPRLGEAFTQASHEDRLLFGFAEHDLTSTFLGTSTGVRLRHDQPTGRLELNAKSADYARSVWAGVGTDDFSDVDVHALEAGLVTKLDWARRRVDLPAGRYETVLPPSAVADLYVFLYASTAAREAYDGRSAFSATGGGTRIGERLGDTPFTLRSDPAAPGLRSCPFVVARSSSSADSVFDNGLPIAPVSWIDAGTLSALLQTRHTASLTDSPATFAVDNLIGEGGDDAAGTDTVVANTSRGLLLTSLWYIRPVDPRTLLFTGLTRDGVYLVEGGEVVGAVNNFRFNESPVEMLRRILEIGGTRRTLARELGDYFTRTAMPTLRVADFNMSTVSDAS